MKDRVSVEIGNPFSYPVDQRAVIAGQIELGLLPLQPLYRIELRDLLAVAVAQRVDHAGRRGDAGDAPQLGDEVLDKVVRDQHRVGVEDEFDIALEIARFDLDAGGLADRVASANDPDGEIVGRGEGLRDRGGIVVAAVVDDRHRARLQRLPHDRSEA